MEFNRNKRFGGGSGGSRDGGGGGKKFYGKPSGERSSFGGGRSSFGGRDGVRPQMHQAICDDCGNECEVPFRPSGDKPVFCNNCFKRDGDSGNVRGGRDFSRPSYGRDRDSERPAFKKDDNYGNNRDGGFKKSFDNAEKPADKYKEQLDALNTKLDKILMFLAPAAIVVNKQEQAKVEEKSMKKAKAEAEPVKKSKVEAEPVKKAKVKKVKKAS
jgi:CxxC-x17-CxxC domain-containing protein